jgi:hypothetical protein
MDNDTTVVPAHFPELARLAWNRDLSRPISGQEALGLYEANWRHVEIDALSLQEWQLIKELADCFGGGHLLISK